MTYLYDFRRRPTGIRPGARNNSAYDTGTCGTREKNHGDGHCISLRKLPWELVSTQAMIIGRPCCPLARVQDFFWDCGFAKPTSDCSEKVVLIPGWIVRNVAVRAGTLHVHGNVIAGCGHPQAVYFQVVIPTLGAPSVEATLSAGIVCPHPDPPAADSIHEGEECYCDCEQLLRHDLLISPLLQSS